MVKNLRKIIESDIFDYAQLTDVLSDYGNIRTKIGRLIASGEIIRIKKGIYTFPDYLRRSPLNPCIIANMMYGPSYVSCDFALAHYGMIPEQVRWVTSMTTGRQKKFTTPVGNFMYFQRNSADYPIGIECIETSSGSFLMASREKALYDKTLTDKRFDGDNIEVYLRDDLRIEEEVLCSLYQSANSHRQKLRSRQKMDFCCKPQGDMEYRTRIYGKNRLL